MLQFSSDMRFKARTWLYFKWNLRNIRGSVETTHPELQMRLTTKMEGKRYMRCGINEIFEIPFKKLG